MVRQLTSSSRSARYFDRSVPRGGNGDSDDNDFSRLDFSRVLRRRGRGGFDSTGLRSELEWRGAFGDLDEAARSDLTAIMFHRKFHRGQVVVSEGDQADYAYGVVQGGIKLLKSLRDGRTLMTGYLLPGDFLGLSLQGTHTCSVEAFSETKLCQFPMAALRALFERRPCLQLRLIKATYDLVAEAQEHMLLLGRKTVAERVCSFLISHLNRVEAIVGPVKSITLPLRRNEIGDYLGVTMETVSRTFSALQRDGLIYLERASEISIKDRNKLAAIAKDGSAKNGPAHSDDISIASAPCMK